MKKEFRSRNLIESRIIDSATNGGFSGYACIKGFLDDYGTIWVDNSFTELDELVRKGFVPDSHAIETGAIYTLNSNLARFTVAKEDARGLYIETEFLDSQRAQEARSQVGAYISNDQEMGLSIGFEKRKSFRVYPKDYAIELKKYLKPQFLEEGLRKANNYAFVEIMQDTPIRETSITLIPANEEAGILEVRSAPVEKRAQYLGQWFEESVTLSSLRDVLDALMYNVFYDVVCNEEMTVEQGSVILNDACDEAKNYILEFYKIIMTLEASNDAANNERAQSLKLEVRNYFCNPNFSSIAELPKEQRKEAAIAALRSIINYEISRAKLRVSQKEKGIRAGAVVSKTNWNDLNQLHSDMSNSHETFSDEMLRCLGDLREFLDKHNPDESRSKVERLRVKALQRKYIYN